MGGAHAAAVGGEVLSHDGGQGLVGEADVVEGPVDGDGGHVFLGLN